MRKAHGSALLAFCLALGCAARGASEPRTQASTKPAARGTAPNRLAKIAPRDGAKAPGPPASTPAAPRDLGLPLAEVTATGPLSLEQVGHGGAWLAFCEAKSAARLAFVAGVRAPELLDDLLGWDETGRYVVVRKGGNAWLVDVASDQRTNLTALGFDDRDDQEDFRQHRALAFDPRGEVLAYLRKKPAPALVLRTLASGDERLVSSLPGEPWRLAWEASASTLVVSTVTEDTTRNGTLDFPVRLRKTPRQRCNGLLPHFHLAPETGDRPSAVLVSRDGTIVRQAPEFVLPFGLDYVSRSTDGALALELPNKRQPLADADCGARVLYSDPARNLLVVTCTNDKVKPKRLGVELVGPGYRKELGVAVQSQALDRWPGAPKRLLALYPGSDTILLDLDERKTLTLQPGDRVLATSGTQALLRREKTLVWFDASTGVESVAATGLARLDGFVAEGSLVATNGLVLDVAGARVLGSAPGNALALTPKGAVLVPDGGRASAEAFARGPLHWHSALAEPPHD